jgi:nucleotide-binding universal stress UspA family protein
VKRFRSILVHVDTRTDTKPLLERATELARAQGSRLKIVEIVPDLPWSMLSGKVDLDEMRQLLVEKKTTAVEALAAQARSKGIEASGKVLTGKTSVQLIDEVSRESHDLVMKAAKGPESTRLGFLGTSATRLLRHSPCAVWVFRPSHHAGQRRIVAAVDVTAADEQHAQLNREILAVALALADGKPHIAYAWSVYGERLIKDYMKKEEFDELMADSQHQARCGMEALLTEFGISANAPEVHLLHGPEDEAIARFVDEGQFDALVIGTVGRSGLSGVLVGNTAEVLLGRVHCSVVAVKPQPSSQPMAS